MHLTDGIRFILFFGIHLINHVLLINHQLPVVYLGGLKKHPSIFSSTNQSGIFGTSMIWVGFQKLNDPK